jgi:hypothetical protein
VAQKSAWEFLWKEAPSLAALWTELFPLEKLFRDGAQIPLAILQLQRKISSLWGAKTSFLSAYI